MATMPGETQQEKPRGQTEDQQGKVRESTKNTLPEGHHSPGTRPGAGDAPREYETPEPKRRVEGSEGEPNAHPKRAPEHEPGYEAKHRKEAQGHKQHDDANKRSQADDSKAQIDARDDEDALHRQKGQRAHTAARKSEVKRGRPAKAKKPVRKHR
jgi:hypothetical protein